MKKINFFGRVNPDGRTTVERRSNDGQSQGHYTLGLTKFLFTLITLITLLTLSVGQMWADDGDFYNMYIAYSFEGAGGAIDGADNNTGVTVDAGTLTSGSLTLTGVYLKCWDDWGQNFKSSGGQLCYTNKGGSTQYISCTRSGKSGNNYEYQNSNPGVTLASYNQASGSFEFHCWGQTWGWGDRYFPKSSGHYVLKYKIAPPAVSSFAVSTTGSNILSGSGTSGDPYIIAYNGTLSLSITGSKHHTDGNSSAQYYNTSSSDAWSGTSTKSITSITSTTKASVTVKMRYYNSTAKIGGTESSTTIYYKSEAAYSVTVSAGAHGSVSPSGAQSNIGTLSGLSVSATPSTGYNFNTWTISSGSGSFTSAATTASNKFKPTAASTITASFTAKTTTVTLQANAPGGQTVTGGGTTVTATYDAALPAFSALSCTGGYALKGYYTNTSGGTKVINADGSFNANSGIWNRLDGATLTLHAQWSLDRTLTYSGNGNTSGDVPAEPAVYANGASATVLGNTGSLAKTGYTFNNWNTEAGGGGSSYSAGNTITMNANYTLYAQWRENNYTVTVNAGSNGSVASGSVTGHYDTKVTLPAATANTGYHFSTWTTTSGSVTYTNQTSATEAQVNGLTAAATVRADFAANTYSVVFNKNGGTGTMGNQAFTYNAAATALTSNAFTRSGYTFLGWATSSSRADALTVDYTNGQSVRNLTSENGGTYNLYAVWAKDYYIGGRFQHDWEDGNATTNKMTYDASSGYYKFATNKTVSELSVQWHNVSGDYYADQYFYIHTGKGKGATSSQPTYVGASSNGHSMQVKIGYANAYVLTSKTSSFSEFTDAMLLKFSNVDNLSSSVIVWWDPANKKVWYTATESLNTNYYLLGFGEGSWSEVDGRRFKVAAVNATTATVSVSLTAKTYSGNNDGFKVENGGTWYTKAGSTITRASNTVTASETGGSNNNMSITADLAGSYTFTLNLSTKAISVTYPTAYQLNYSIGTVAGNSGSISSAPTTATGSYVGSGNSVTLTAPDEKTGYTWKGWYLNADGSGVQQCATKAYAVTMNADKTLYACYTENTFNVSASASPAAGGSVTPTSATSMGQITGGDITASPNPGYSFTSWAISSGSGYFGASGTATTSTTANTKFRPTAAATLTGTFSEVLRTVGVTVNNSYLGSVSPASLTNVGPVTKSAEVTATAETGASFSSWTLPSGVTAAAGYTTSSNPIKVNATAADKTITANFAETTYAVTLTTADASKGTVGSSKSVGQITAVEITATPKSGYMFSKWVKTAGSGTVTYYTGAGNGQLTDASGEEKETTYICVTGAVTLQATWEPDRSSGYVVHYGNNGKNADKGDDASQTRPWKDGKLYRATTEASDVSYFTFTASVADVDKVIYFKIHKLDGDTWYGNAGKITNTISNWTFSTGIEDARLCIIMPGSYKFTWNKSTNKLSVTYPDDVYYVRGGFNSWRWSHPMTETSSGVYSATVNMTEANHTYSGDNGFKLLIAGQYYGKNSTTVTRSTSTGSAAISSCSTSGANIGITTDYTGNYTFTYTVATNTLQVTYPTAYKVTYGKGTVDGSASNCSAVDIDNGGAAVTSNSTWVKSGNRVVLTAPAAKSGYTYDGWFDNNSGSGEAITTNANCTITVSSALTRYACYHANTYTVSFNNNGGSGATPDAITVTYDAPYGALPAGPTPPGAGQFAGWFTESSGGTLVTAETIVSTASNHTLYAQYESIYAVNVDFKCGDAKVFPSTVVSASPTSLTPTIIAPVIFGYSFNGWTGSSVTFADASNDTTTITATAATTVTASYAEVPTVYFKNNLEWDSVFVSFDITWTTAGGKEVPVNNGKPYYAMTQIGTTDIYYCEIPSTYTASNYASWSANIAFDNKNYNHKATAPAHTGNMASFYQGEFTGRGDFDPKATLFIPYNGDKDARNSGTFYQTGCWMKYNSTESGYQVNMNTMVSGNDGDTLTVALTAANAGGYEFSAKLNLKHPNYTYGFKLYKDYQKSSNDIWYTNTGTINSSTETLPWHFWAGSGITFDSQRCGLHTEALGDYTISVSFATGRPMVNVEYPTQVGDWRLAYNDRIAWSGAAHDASWYLYSRVIKAKANAEDLVSFYVSKAVGANAHIELQKCTAINPKTGAETWTQQGSNLDLSSITGTGIYNFKITQDGSKVASAAYDGAYEGNFYIRTDVSDGGWTNYKNASNVMTYSEYAEDNSGFTHYFMRFVETGLNIKFCIANDYSPRLTEYCINDDYTGEYISVYGNVRFMWDHRTNAVSRAYISGSSFVADRFLVLEGDAKLFDENGKALTPAGGGKIAGLNDNEMKFIDDQNWIYETTVEAIPGSKFKLTAKYNNKIQYFYGDEGSDPADSVLLLGGSGGDKYEMRIVYDFKTNRLIKAFVPEGAITTDLEIETDLMIIRDHQDDAKQITFGGSGKLSEVKTVYGAMKFNKYTLNGKERTGGHASTSDSRYKRDLFYISFPFDVKLNEAFGFGTYGKHWIIEYYDGKTRAANGFWADSDPNWKFVTPAQRNSGYTMKAFEGYILALDLDELTESSEVWYNGVENVYIYFPSSALVEEIAATNRLIEIDQDGYECTINRNTPDGDRRVKDSYWHCIGVPSFANYSGTLYDVNGGTAIDWRDNDGGDLWKTPNLPYLYTINWADKSLSVSSTANFNFQATWSYLVQYEKSSIYWSNVNVTPAAIVARKHTAPTNAEFCIELQQAGEKADQTFVRLTNDEAVTNGFDFNYDLSKEFNKNKANIYTMVTTVMGDDDNSVTQAAGNCLPMTEQTTIVPLGMKIAKAGEYTIAIPSGTSGVGVTLVDNETGIRTNLALEDYTVALEAGTQDDRFYLEISPIKHVATDIELLNGENGENGVRKVMNDGILYIIRDGRVFNAQGARVK